MNTAPTAATDAERTLHERLLAGDMTAPAEVFERFIEPVTNALLGWRERGPDTHLFEDVAYDAVNTYVQRPAQYDAARRSLAGYLIMSARGDLANALQKERRRNLRLVSADDATPAFELLLADGNNSVEEQVLDKLPLELPKGLSRQQALHSIAEAFPNPVDFALLLLCLDQERKTEPYARVLGLSELAPKDQRTEVKRHKDRIKKRLDRLRAKLVLETEGTK